MLTLLATPPGTAATAAIHLLWPSWPLRGLPLTSTTNQQVKRKERESYDPALKLELIDLYNSGKYSSKAQALAAFNKTKSSNITAGLLRPPAEPQQQQQHEKSDAIVVDD